MTHAQLSFLRDVEAGYDQFGLTAHPRRFSDIDPTKLRGGYYTPHHVATWMVNWAIRTPKESVLEPSCGDGVFLEAAIAKLRSLSSRRNTESVPVLGVEYSSDEAALARARALAVAGSSIDVRVLNADFFDWWLSSKRRQVDVVVGNPPFIRYQSFPEPSRGRAMQAMRMLGLSPNRLTNSWVPFVVASADCLQEGGRLAFVVPAELLQVSYAAQLRSFLTDRFSRIDVVACNDLIFEKAEQEVVLLLADGARRSSSSNNLCLVGMSEIGRVGDLEGISPEKLLARTETKDVRHDSEKWLKYFLSNREIGLMRAMREHRGVAQFGEHAQVDVGVVTGKNSFFLLDKGQVERLRVGKFVRRLVGRSVHIQGARLLAKDWEALARSEQRVYLLDIGTQARADLPKACRDYVAAAEKLGIHKGYKCSIRSPWYGVPSPWEPDAFLFRQIYDFPRVVVNRAGATSTDTIHRVRCKYRPDLLAANVYTSLTAASAEIEGRSYGGGVLELEPTEAERLLVPRELSGALPVAEIDKLVRQGKLRHALEENDKLVLQHGIGLAARDCKALKGIWERMRERRATRARSTAAVVAA